MARKKKSSAGKAKSTPKAAPLPETVPYEDLVAARRAMETAHARVYQADLELRAAYADHSDFKLRDDKTAVARAILNEARNLAAAATRDFEALQTKARKLKAGVSA